MNRANVYQTIGRESEILGATPYQQVELLLNNAVQEIHAAVTALEQRDINAKASAISKANNIVNHLHDSVNLKAGGELAFKLDRIYFYLEKELFFANARNSVDKLQDCLVIMNNLKTWWAKVNIEEICLDD